MPRFRIVYTDKAAADAKVPYSEWNDWNNYEYDTFKEAKEECQREMRRHENYDGTPRYVFVPYKIPANEDHIAREAAKVADGQYTRLPEHMQYHSSHHARLIAEKTMIGYYASEHDARHDKLTEIKPTRYFITVCGYSDQTCWDFMAELGLISGECTLKFATTREDIKRVYIDGPASCMSGDSDNYSSRTGGIHPAEAYATEDLELAYMERGDEITARALCNAKTKEYVRIYGDETRMIKLLEEAGYSLNQWCLGGCQLLKIIHKTGGEGGRRRRTYLVVPYLDGLCNEIEFSRENDFVKIVSRPQIYVACETLGGICID